MQNKLNEDTDLLTVLWIYSSCLANKSLTPIHRVKHTQTDLKYMSPQMEWKKHSLQERDQLVIDVGMSGTNFRSGRL